MKTRLISCIINFAVDQDIEGIALFIDLKKTLDSLEWEYLFKALDTFQFGPVVRLGSQLYTQTFLAIF